MLKPSILDRKCKDSGVMVKAKIIISSLDPLYLLRSKLWQPAEILSKIFECTREIYAKHNFRTFKLYFLRIICV